MSFAYLDSDFTIEEEDTLTVSITIEVCKFQTKFYLCVFVGYNALVSIFSNNMQYVI